MRLHGNFLDSGAPQLFARQRSAFRESMQLRPRNLWMHPPAEAAVGAGDHVFAADEIGKGEDAIGHQVGVFDDVGAWLTAPPNTIGEVSICNLSTLSNSIQEKTSAPGQLRRYAVRLSPGSYGIQSHFSRDSAPLATVSPATHPLRGMEE
jgi:hypothetical protein